MIERPALRLRNRAAEGIEGARPEINPSVAKDKEIIRVAEPLIGPEEAAEVAEVLASTLVSSVSPAVSEFEMRLAARCETTDASAVTCGTHALDLLCTRWMWGPATRLSSRL